MKLFIKKITLLVLLPFVVYAAIVIYWDPFKVFFSYDDYYTNNPVTGNREDICLKLLNKHPRATAINNFIIGSSRSQAFKTNEWAKRMKAKNDQTFFHYDGSSLGLYRSKNAINYLSEHSKKINTILWIIDPDFFGELQNPSGHLFIQPPAVSHENKWLYYFKFVLAAMDFHFVMSNVVYYLDGKTYHDFMGFYIGKSKYYHTCKNLTADIYYSYDKDIAKDSTGYYQNLLKKGVFYKRPIAPIVSKQLINEEQLILLQQIKEIKRSKKFQLKIVISPLYNQIKFNPKDLQSLENIFGKENIYDFSGKNVYTNDFRNYYESSHFKPYIANQILDAIYSENIH
ncbi:MAG: hypothetical protein ACKOX3_10780 [Bacteroidota bacterium]